MTIVYLITTAGHGKGGHFHSLNTIANEMGIRQHDVYIVNVGVKQSEVLDENSFSVNYFKYNGYNFFSVLIKLKKFVKQLKPDAVHAFDVESFAFARLLTKQLDSPSILTKCGGPDPKKYYPKADYQVLFSIENLKYFENNKRYKNTQLAFVPNRVKKVSVDTKRIDEFKKIHGKHELSILRISRIGKHYHKSILQSINILEWLLKKGIKIRLILLGTIQSNEVFKDIKDFINSKNLNDNIIIETSNQFTHNASQLLELGDLIVGTGRNFMEASSLNKLLLVPYQDSDFPLLVKDSNFKVIFSTNFSPRTVIKNYNQTDNLNQILNIVKNNLNSDSKTWFDSYFDISKGAEQYEELYLTKERNIYLNGIDMLLNIMYSIKTFVN